MTLLMYFFKAQFLIFSCLLLYLMSFTTLSWNCLSLASNTPADIVLEKNDITQYYFPNLSEPLEITNEEFSTFVMYLKHRLKRKLLKDMALQQQVVGTCAKEICGIFHHHVYDPIQNQCKSFKKNLKKELEIKPYLELTRAGRNALIEKPLQL